MEVLILGWYVIGRIGIGDDAGLLRSAAVFGISATPVLSVASDRIGLAGA